MVELYPAILRSSLGLQKGQNNSFFGHRFIITFKPVSSAMPTKKVLEQRTGNVYRTWT